MLLCWFLLDSTTALGSTTNGCGTEAQKAQESDAGHSCASCASCVPHPLPDSGLMVVKIRKILIAGHYPQPLSYFRHESKEMKRARSTAALFILTTALLCRLTVVTTVEAQGDLNAGNSSLSLSALKGLSLEQLANIDVTTESKQPVRLSQSPAAIDVLTGDDIRRSGVTTIVDALRLVPGVEVARIDANQWSVGIRGFGTRLSRSMLVLIDGRTVYTPLFAGTYWEVQDTLLPRHRSYRGHPRAGRHYRGRTRSTASSTSSPKVQRTRGAPSLSRQAAIKCGVCSAAATADR